MRHTPNFVCKLCMSGITTASLQVQLLATQARRSLHFPQLDSLLHELDELGSLRIFNVRSSYVTHLTRRLLVVYYRTTIHRTRSLVVYFRSSIVRPTVNNAHGHRSHGQPRPVGTSTRAA